MATRLSDVEQTFNAPNTVQNILSTVQRIEARLANASIAKRNRLHFSNNTGVTIYTARQKQVGLPFHEIYDLSPEIALW
jgi:hypothetical protein